MFQSILNVMNRHAGRGVAATCLGAMLMGMTTSCSDFFEPDSDRIIYADDSHLNNATDTLYSVAGILGKLQALGDRTILLGEMRGDLVDINDVTSADLRNLSLFNIDDNNAYNKPADYYAVINNCNYFIAKADTTLKNNRNEYIFMKEYAVVKGIRAWTYLQLALNYGSVPFVTEPILTKEQAEKDYARKNIKEICEYFINDIQNLAEVEQPGYGEIRGLNSRLMYFPIYLLLGELHLWAADEGNIEHYKQAALNYYNYINRRNGTNSIYPIGAGNSTSWPTGTNTFTQYSRINNSFSSQFFDESYSATSEMITIIPGDSIPSEGNYSQLRNLFNVTVDNNAYYSIELSEGMKEISAAQTCTYLQSNEGGIAKYGVAPKGIGQLLDGDLRLYSVWDNMENMIINGERKNYQYVDKYSTRNIHIYRKAMVYLRLAEAMNRAGYPHFGYYVLASGVNNKLIEDSIMKYYPTSADSNFLRQFDFPTSRYVLRTPDNSNTANTMGIHDRGCGWSLQNPDYLMPFDSTLVDENTGQYDAQLQLEYQKDQVERMIIDECALELAFEGTRFYDLMRVALRRNDPAFLADRVYSRRGAAKKAEMQGLIQANLMNTENWYLRWNGKIGIEPASK